MGSPSPRRMFLTGVMLAPLVLGADVTVEIGPRRPHEISNPTRICPGDGAKNCGNGVVDPGEECDPGAAEAPGAPEAAACRTDCTIKRCGDGIVDAERGEQCDRGDVVPGDGCSPRCFLEPPPTARIVGGRGPRQTECVIAWKLAGLHDSSGGGLPAARQVCVDGDPRCDRDGSADGTCLFHLWLCANNSEPRELPCRPGTGRDGVGVVALAEVRKPTPQDAARRDLDAENYRQLLAAAAAAPVGSNADVCGPRIEMQVPTRAGRRGARTIRLRATSSRNAKDADALKLVCLPSGSPAVARAGEGGGNAGRRPAVEAQRLPRGSGSSIHTSRR